MASCVTLVEFDRFYQCNNSPLDITKGALTLTTNFWEGFDWLAPDDENPTDDDWKIMSDNFGPLLC